MPSQDGLGEFLIFDSWVALTISAKYIYKKKPLKRQRRLRLLVCLCQYLGLGFNKSEYRNDPKFSDRYAWANSADPDQKSSLIRVYTVCHSVCIIWTHYSRVEPHSSNFSVITTNFLGVQIFRKFTVMPHLLGSKEISNDQELIQSDSTSCPQNQKGNLR